MTWTEADANRTRPCGKPWQRFMVQICEGGYRVMDTETGQYELSRETPDEAKADAARLEIANVVRSA